MNDMTVAEFESISPVEHEQEPIEVQDVCMPASGLRQMAFVLERISATGLPDYCEITHHVFASSKEEFAILCRALGRFTKSADNDYFTAERKFDGGVTLKVCISRGKLCKRVLLRTEDVPEQIIPASKREVYGWECMESVLSTDKNKAEALA